MIREITLGLVALGNAVLTVLASAFDAGCCIVDAVFEPRNRNKWRDWRTDL